MAKKPTVKPRYHWWAVYHIAARRKFIGLIEDAPDERAAITRAIERYKVPPNERAKLMALRRD